MGQLFQNLQASIISQRAQTDQQFRTAQSRRPHPPPCWQPWAENDPRQRVFFGIEPSDIRADVWRWDENKFLTPLIPDTAKIAPGHNPDGFQRRHLAVVQLLEGINRL